MSSEVRTKEDVQRKRDDVARFPQKMREADGDDEVRSLDKTPCGSTGQLSLLTTGKQKQEILSDFVDVFSIVNQLSTPSMMITKGHV